MPTTDMHDKFVPGLRDDHSYSAVQILFTFIVNVVEYIAGWVLRKLSPTVACADCSNVLFCLKY